MTALELVISTAQASGHFKEDFSRNAPSSPSAASSTSDSVFSNGDARSSQSSAPSSVKGSPLTYESSDNDVSDTVSNVDSVNDQLGQDFSQTSLNHHVSQGTRPAVPAIHRRHPRRTCAKAERSGIQHEATKPVPTLVRQCDRKEQFVESLVDTATEMIEVIWPRSKGHCSLPEAGRNILDLRKFVQEVLRRSKTSHSTLQVALFYLMLLIPFVPKAEASELVSDPVQSRALKCGRRMFLAALILASKYLQDRNYTMSAWAKISGLKKEEICVNELAFLKTVDYDLHVPESKYKTWTEIVFKCSVDDEPRMERVMNGGRCEKWRSIIPHLTADLSAVETSEMRVCKQIPVPTPSTTPASSNRWSPPASPFSASGSERSESPLSIAGFAPPPPQFLEPRVTTPADRVRFPTSPKLSKLETPCLPPINLDCPPAASRSQLTPTLAKCPAMGLAMKQAQILSADRRCADVRPCALGPRIMSKLCSRRSALSQCSSSSGESDVSQVDSRKAPTARESFPRASNADETGVESDPVATFAACSLLNLKNTNSASAYPTPESMRSLSNGSSFDSDGVSTPKVSDPANRPLAKSAQKRARPLSKCENELEFPTFSTSMVASPEATEIDVDRSVAGMIHHRGGILVDYSAGVDDGFARSRGSHLRSASGSRNGARKKPCSSLATCLRA